VILGFQISEDAQKLSRVPKLSHQGQRGRDQGAQVLAATTTLDGALDGGIEDLDGADPVAQRKTRLRRLGEAVQGNERHVMAFRESFHEMEDPL
jgi:hypothetical protein